MSEDTMFAALKDARANQTAHLEALFRMQDVSALRLTALHDRLLPEVSLNSEAAALFSLDLNAGVQPRLWLGLGTSIVMEPDPKTYRLVQLQETARATLFETQDELEMRRFALRQIAHAIVLRRQILKPVSVTAAFIQTQRLFYWLLGVVCGGLGFGLAAYASGLLRWR